MADLVKCLTEVQKDKVNLLSLNELSGQVFNKLYPLGFTRVLLTETMLQFIQYMMFVEVSCKIGRNDMLHYLAAYTGGRYRPVVGCVSFVSLFQ